LIAIGCSPSCPCADAENITDRPSSGNNFPVALLTDEDKRAIPLAQPKPQVLQPVVLAKALGDAAHLATALRARLRDLGQPATRGSAVVTGRIVYLDNVNDGVPGAIMPRLQYEPAADGLRVTLVFLRDGKTLVMRTRRAGDRRRSEREPFDRPIRVYQDVPVVVCRVRQAPFANSCSLRSSGFR